MLAHIPMDYAVTRHVGDIKGSGLSLTNVMPKPVLFGDSGNYPAEH